jgi:hypothetical protein
MRIVVVASSSVFLIADFLISRCTLQIALTYFIDLNNSIVYTILLNDVYTGTKIIRSIKLQITVGTDFVGLEQLGSGPQYLGLRARGSPSLEIA